MELREEFFKVNPNKLICYIRLVGNTTFNNEPFTVERRMQIPEGSTEEERMEAIRESGLCPWYYYTIEDRRGKHIQLRHHIINHPFKNNI